MLITLVPGKKIGKERNLGVLQHLGAAGGLGERGRCPQGRGDPSIAPQPGWGWSRGRQGAPAARRRPPLHVTHVSDFISISFNRGNF